jgi:hypothetical protein
MIRRQGFLLKDIQPRGGDAAAVQSPDQGGLVYYRSPGNIDNNSPHLHPGKGFGVDAVAGTLVQGNMEGNKIRFPDKPVKGSPFSGHTGKEFAFNMGIRDEDAAESEALNFFPKSPAGNAETHDPQGPAGHAPYGLVQVPSPGTNPPIFKGNTPDTGKEQPQGVFRHLFGTVTGHIGNPDSPFFRGDNIYIVESYAIPGYDTAFRKAPNHPSGHGRLVKEYPIGVGADPYKFILGMAVSDHQIGSQIRKYRLFFVVLAEPVVADYYFHIIFSSKSIVFFIESVNRSLARARL